MIRRFLLLFALAAALVVAGVPGTALTPSVAVAAQDDADEQATEDILVLSTGQTVRGTIIEETPDSIRMLVRVGSLEAETTYDRNNVLEIKRDQPTGMAPNRSPGERNPRTPSSSPSRDSGDTPTWDPNDETARIYYTEIEGFVPQTLSKESLERIFEDVDETFGDVTTTYIGSDEVERVIPEARDKNIVVIRINTDTSEGSAFQGIYAAEAIAPLIRNEIDQKGRRVIFWVEGALQGGVFVPLTSPELFFTSSAVMGGIGSLDAFDTGDDMVDEKLIGAMLGVAEGFVIRSGYGDTGVNIIRAMSRPQYHFSVNTSGGRADTMLREPRPEDGPAWRVIARPGQPLNLDADLAFKLGISKGTVDTLEDLAFELDIHRNYKVVEDHRAERIVRDWEDSFRTAIERINQRNGELWIEFAEIEQRMNNAQDRSDFFRYRGQAIRKLREIRSVISRFESYFDPGGQWRAEIDLQIALLKERG